MMKKALLLAVMTAVSIMAYAQTKISLTVGDRTMTATLVDNGATRALASLLEAGPVTVDMNDYGSFEKVGALPGSLPASNTQLTTEPGDIMLYQSNQMVIFYGSNTWSYTRLGKIDGATADVLRQFLGTGSIKLRLTLGTSDVDNILTDAPEDSTTTVYDLTGRRVTSRPLAPGFYLINGHKTLIRR